MRKTILVVLAGLGVSSLIGCSAGGAAWTGLTMGKNVARTDSHLRVWVDGQPAEQNMLKKAATGHSNWTVAQPVGTSPSIKFELSDPARFGRITSVIVNVYQKFEADYSHQPEFTIVSRDSMNPEAQMRAGMTYNLGNPGGEFRTLNLTGKDVTGVVLQPGKEYMLQITVRADKSETAQVFFRTN